MLNTSGTHVYGYAVPAAWAYRIPRLRIFVPPPYTMGSLLALAKVVLLQGFDEFLDALDWWNWTGIVHWSEMLKDTILTLAVPMVLSGVWMLWRRRFRAARATALRGYDRPGYLLYGSKRTS